MFTNNIIYVLVVIIFILYYYPYSKIFGKNIWYKEKKVITFELDGKETSQLLIDIYSLSHISHGILFYFLFNKLGYNDKTNLYLTIILEFIWEIFENTPFIINKYRKNSAYKNYKGDSIINIIGDLIFTIIGYYLTCKYPKVAVFYLITSEIILSKYNASLIDTSIGSLL